MKTPCDICKGACCESIVVTAAGFSDEAHWLRLHGKDVGGDSLEIEAPCRKLCNGRCSIHDYRPSKCRLYAVGGPDCRATVLRRRPEQAKEILAAMAG